MFDFERPSVTFVQRAATARAKPRGPCQFSRPCTAPIGRDLVTAERNEMQGKGSGSTTRRDSDLSAEKTAEPTSSNPSCESLALTRGVPQPKTTDENEIPQRNERTVLMMLLPSFENHGRRAFDRNSGWLQDIFLKLARIHEARNCRDIRCKSIPRPTESCQTHSLPVQAPPRLPRYGWHRESRASGRSWCPRS